MVGLIPAHAGKTRLFQHCSSQFRAHPRSRGENKGGGAQVPTCEGSSPLTRGKQSYVPGFGALGGLIPAHAGKTMRLSQQGLITRAHPRSRGENRVQAWRTLIRPGSSPLTRGKQPACDGGSNIDWLIPAHAGKTRSRRALGNIPQAHPRSRGENRIFPHQGVRSSGLIPAHAGKTATASSSR